MTYKNKLCIVLIAIVLNIVSINAIAVSSSFEYIRPEEVRTLWHNESHFEKTVDFRFYRLPDERWLLLGSVEYTNTKNKYVEMVEADAIVCPNRLIESGKLGMMKSLDWVIYANENPLYRDPEVLPGDACFVQAVEPYKSHILFEPREKKTLYFEDVISCESPDKYTVYLYDSGHMNLPENE